MKRVFSAQAEKLLKGLAFVFVAFQVITAAIPIATIEQRAIHVGFTVTLILLTCKMRRNEGRLAILGDLLLCGVVVTAAANMYFSYEFFLSESGESRWWDILLGWSLFFVVIEICRRTSAWTLLVLVVLLALYALFGNYIPGDFGHRGFSPTPLVQQMYQSTRGLWGSITNVSATTLAMFIIYGIYIGATGAGDMFISIATKIAGHIRGGPPLVAVGASALAGTISGSAMANVVISGNLTIPTMKRLHYRAPFAGAVEAVASTGSQLMPPIMGAGAFLMAELLNIGYPSIVAAAIIPALSYYVLCVAAVRFRAIKQDLPAVPKHEIPTWKEILIWAKLLPFVTSIVVLIWMFSIGFSTEFAGFIAWATLVGLYLFQDLDGAAFVARVKQIFASTSDAADAIVSIIPIILAAGVILGLMNQTGMPVKISETIGGLAEQSVWFGVAIAGGITLILGMGLPTAGAYLVAATIIAPSIVNIGFEPLAAHMFIFYFAVLSAITPPVCVAVIATLPISGASFAETVWESVLLVPLAYFLPVMFLLAPEMLLEGDPFTIFTTCVPILVGLAAITGAIQPGKRHHSFKSPPMLLLLIGGIMLLATARHDLQLILSALGFAMCGGGFLLWLRLRKDAEGAANNRSAEAEVQ